MTTSQDSQRAQGYPAAPLYIARGALLAAFFLLALMAFFSWYAKLPALSIVFGVLALPPALIALLVGSVGVSDRGIWTRTPVGNYGMRWVDVRAVEYDQFGLVFLGKGKRLVVLSPSVWSPADRDTLLPMLEQKIAQLNLPFDFTPRTGLRLSKNTRLR